MGRLITNRWSAADNDGGSRAIEGRKRFGAEGWAGQAEVLPVRFEALGS